MAFQLHGILYKYSLTLIISYKTLVVILQRFYDLNKQYCQIVSKMSSKETYQSLLYLHKESRPKKKIT